MNNTITADPFITNYNGTTHTDYSRIPIVKTPTLEEQVEALRKEIDELRQEITVIKTLLPGPVYGYSVTNASE